MICDGSSTKSQATLVPARLRISTRLSEWCSRCPNSWKMVSTSRCVSSAGLPPTGGVRLPQIAPTCGSQPRGALDAGDQRVHPGAAALVLARIPVGIETSQQRAVLVVDRVVLRPRIPDRRARLLGHAHAEQAPGDLEHAVDHALQREVRPQRLLVEVVQRLALLLGVVGHVPGLEFARAVRKLAAEGLQFLVLARGSAPRSSRFRSPRNRARALAGLAPCGRPARNRRNRDSRPAAPSRAAARGCGAMISRLSNSPEDARVA